MLHRLRRRTPPIGPSRTAAPSCHERRNSEARLGLDHHLEALAREPGAARRDHSRTGTLGRPPTPSMTRGGLRLARRTVTPKGTRALIEVLLHRHTAAAPSRRGIASALKAGALTLEARKAADRSNARRDRAPAPGRHPTSSLCRERPRPDSNRRPTA